MMPNSTRIALLIAFHFPPLAGSSGIQRTLRFVQHLPEFGWTPVVLTVNTRAYERTSTDLEREIPASVCVRRAFAIDARRHLGVGGRYLQMSARPDRWASWRFDGVRQGMRLIRELEPSVLWSTYPIASAHVIGLELHRRSGLPWIADFRDPMAQEGYPADPLTWRAYERIERSTVSQADVSLFTASGAAESYRQRYPEFAERIRVLENGYDEASFSRLDAVRRDFAPLVLNRTTLLHSGIVYQHERDPTSLMIAVRRMLEAGMISKGRFCIRFRAPVSDDFLHEMAVKHGVRDFVEIMPPIGYVEALEEMMRADGLLVMQAANCNAQVPAKVYEYLRTYRPIICLSDASGDTWGVLRQAGCRYQAALDNPERIAATIAAWISQTASGCPANSSFIQSASRSARTQALAELMNTVSLR